MATASAFGWQTWNSGPFRIERGPGKAPGTLILRFRGPFTLRDVYSSLPTMEFTKMLDLEPAPGEQPPIKNILDMTECTFVDSSGLGMLVTHHVRCEKRGVRLIAAGLNHHVRELFHLTKIDTLIAIAESVEEAEAA
ncbi:MAG: STAS domain-containing protein [Terracidiphilus sp.]